LRKNSDVSLKQKRIYYAPCFRSGTETKKIRFDLTERTTTTTLQVSSLY